jgi:hypothetical protein
MAEKIIDAVSPDDIQAELTPNRMLRTTNKGGNEIYIVDAFNAPNTMREIGRLREIAFRTAGGGTGKECDIDHFDVMDPPCRQLLVWSPQDREIIGGYRFILGKDIKLINGKPRIATSHMFNFSPEFISDYLPHTIELGRSFVRLEYQSSRVGAKAIFALDNLWDGLGALTVEYPDIRYLFGKFTMYPSYDRECRDMLLYFLGKYFRDQDGLVTPYFPIYTGDGDGKFCEMFSGDNFTEDYRTLNNAIRNHGITIPPLVNAYMSLSPTMKIFGTAINDEFGDVEETGIFITISEVYAEKINRHINTYHRDQESTFIEI